MPGITDDTKLMLHFWGLDGAKCFHDASDSNHCFFPVDHAQIDTAIKKWSTGSLKLDGSNDCITSPDSPDWNVVASNLDDWTIDFQAYHEAVDEDATYITQVQHANDRWVFTYGAAVDVGVKFIALVDGTPIINLDIGGRLAAATTFYHIALCKVADKYGLYVDGDQLGYVQDNSEANFTGPLYVGDDSYASGQEWRGHADELRIHNANYFQAAPNIGLTDTITPPTEEYARAVVAAGAPPGIHLSRRLSL